MSNSVSKKLLKFKKNQKFDSMIKSFDSKQYSIQLRIFATIQNFLIFILNHIRHKSIPKVHSWIIADLFNNAFHVS